jgi:hypothetical protein
MISFESSDPKLFIDIKNAIVVICFITKVLRGAQNSVNRSGNYGESSSLLHFLPMRKAVFLFSSQTTVPSSEAEGSGPICGTKSQKFAGDSVGSSSMNLKSLHNELDVPIKFTAKMWDDNPKTKEVRANDWEWAPYDGFFPAQLSINNDEYVVNFSDDTNSVMRVMFCKGFKCQVGRPTNL